MPMSQPDYSSLLARRFSLSTRQVGATLKLLEAGATVPFISRYRKEATGSLDEVQIAEIAGAHKRY